MMEKYINDSTARPLWEKWILDAVIFIKSAHDSNQFEI